MDEKEAVRRIRNSFSSGMSRADITRKLVSSRNYKLDYIDKLIEKAQRPKKILVFSIVFLVVLLSLTASAYVLFSSGHKENLSNPLTGVNVTRHSLSLNPEEINITPEFLSYLLNEIGAYQLHKSPLNLEYPRIGFNISNQKFSSTIKNKIETKKELSGNEDILFVGKKEILIDILHSEEVENKAKEYINSGDIQIELKASETELFSKGYLSFYDSLTS